MRPDNPARRRFLEELMEHADRSGGDLQARKRLSGYSETETGDIVASIQRRHWVRDRGVVSVKVHAVAMEACGSLEAFREETCRRLGRAPLDLRRARHEDEAVLQACIEEADPTADERAHLLAQVAAARSWLHRSLRDGRETARRRVRRFTRFFAGLPRPDEEPLRAYLARQVGDSHAFDDDDVLRQAVERRLRERHPSAPNTAEAFLQEGLLTRLSNATVLLYGPLVWRVSDCIIDLRGLASASTAASLTEDAVAKGLPAEPLPMAALFVENPSTWRQLQGRVPDGTLLVLTDGVPNRATQRLAARLGEAGVKLLHWGDIDAGGFLVLSTLQRHARLEGFLMDLYAIERHRDLLVPAGEAKAAAMRANGHPTLVAALAAGGWLEQERIPIAEAARLLAERLAGTSRVRGRADDGGAGNAQGVESQHPHDEEAHRGTV
jgi:hypothetical protein